MASMHAPARPILLLVALGSMLQTTGCGQLASSQTSAAPAEVGTPPAKILAYLIDRSGTSAVEITQRCCAVKEEVQAELNSSRPGAEMSVQILATGDVDEPIALPWSRFKAPPAPERENPFQIRRHESGPTGPVRVVDGNEARLAQLEADCEKRFKLASRRSPIYFAIARALWSIDAERSRLTTRTHGDPSARLLVISDLRETEQSVIQRRLCEPHSSERPFPQDAVLKTGNTDIRVCGISDFTPHGGCTGGDSPERIHQAWKDVFVPPLPSGRIEPSCPGCMGAFGERGRTSSGAEP